MKKLVLLLTIATALTTKAQNSLNILPMPTEVSIGKGVCTVKQPIGFIRIDFEEDENEKQNNGETSFKNFLKKNYRLTRFIDGDNQSYGLPTEIMYTKIGTKKPDGYYELEVKGNKIFIRGTALGKLYAYETLKQMITVNVKNEVTIPNCKIKDNPRFKNRNMQLELSNQQLPIEFINKNKNPTNLKVVPMPAEYTMGKGICMLEQPVGFILVDSEDNDNDKQNDGEELFKNYLKKNFNLTKFVDGDTHSYGLPTEILYTRIGTKKPDGYYELEVTGSKIFIRGTALGKFYAFETLKQMIRVNSKKEIYIPICSIKDYPRFKYRGMHLDVGRHFMPVDFIKKYIDYLAAYKYNTFHWHLTEDQGWRIEIKKYPLLTSVGAFRNGTIIGRYPGKGNDNLRYGGYYTQKQIKDIVQYASDRNIEVIPEIEMPGHSSAAIAAYPQLSCFPDESTSIGKTPWSGSRNGKQVQQTWGVFEDVFAPTEYTFNFLQDVIDEVIQLFPSKYIHIGGDECPKEAWKRSPFCQQLIKENNLKDEHGLQSYFIQRIEKYINSKGKKIIGWDEILEGGLAPNATVMSWRGEEGGIEAAKQNHDVIMTPGSHCYLDHSQSKNEDSVTIGGYLPLEKVYSYEPVPAVLTPEQAKYVLGAQGNVWTEYMGYPSKVEYMIFPRMMALSEVLWSPKDKKDWKDFERRLPSIYKRIEKDKVNYSRAYYDLQTAVLPTDDNVGVLWKIESNNTNARITWVPSFVNSAKHVYEEPILINNNVDRMSATLEDENGKALSTVFQSFHFNMGTGKKITIVNPPSKTYPGDGAFTLVNGVQNEIKLSRSNEFLGFQGTDLDATIDLGKITNIKKVTLHILEQQGSWIYAPSNVEVQYFMSLDSDPLPILSPTKIKSVSVEQGKGIDKVVIESVQNCRYIRIVAKNYGIIPSGNPGAGNPAWLFADEIEVE